LDEQAGASKLIVILEHGEGSKKDESSSTGDGFQIGVQGVGGGAIQGQLTKERILTILLST
jgi:hypothetical protein